MTNHAQRNLLHAYLDDELDLVRSMELEDHLAECAECANDVAGYRALRESVARADLAYHAPAELRSKIVRDLRKVDAAKPEPIRQRAPWWSWAMVAACLLIALGIVVVERRPSATQMLASEIVNDHVRSLMANHLTDVVTSDQHTVKPWFNGKVDFSPQVRDLSADGFELIGGRLDYVHGQNAAAIVYQHRKHLINIFSWPEPGQDHEPDTETIQGFHLYSWKQGGISYCAVSDLNQQELGELVAAYRR